MTSSTRACVVEEEAIEGNTARVNVVEGENNGASNDGDGSEVEGGEEETKPSEESVLLKGGMSAKNIDAIRDTLHVREEDGFFLCNGLEPLPLEPQEGGATSSTTSIVLVKVYVNSKVLSFQRKPRSFLDRDQVVRLLVVAASKGPRASIVDDEPMT